MNPLPTPGTRVEVLLHRGMADEYLLGVTTPKGVLLDKSSPEGDREVAVEEIADWR